MFHLHEGVGTLNDALMVIKEHNLKYLFVFIFPLLVLSLKLTFSGNSLAQFTFTSLLVLVLAHLHVDIRFFSKEAVFVFCDWYRISPLSSEVREFHEASLVDLFH